MTHPDRKSFDTLEDYEDALDDYYVYEDAKFDEMRDDMLTGDL